MNEPLKEIMTTELITIAPDTPLKKAREILGTYRIHHLPIVNENNVLLGLVTTWDLFKLEMSPAEYADIPVSEIMTTHLAVLGPEDKIGSAAELFLEHLFQAVPIVDEDRHLLGIVTMFDILKFCFYKTYDY